eukprot:TRINITY_DN2484_c0_g1_i1.p1 TRINITY_DN2484_c0_g1~~TRINITY_DN2484_c0_g1_i1.p1  ORF type:complete len:539 (+),score=125.08 TRINITY_DN2484_c0_g1_i1:46-1662(+)
MPARCATTAFIAALLAADALAMSPAPPRAPNPSPLRGCCSGLHLKVGVVPFSFPPFWKYDGNASWKYTGFVPDVCDRVIAMEMGATYEFVPKSEDYVTSSLQQLLGDFDMSVEGIEPEIYGRGGDVFEYTAPLYSSEYGGLVLKTTNTVSLWRLFGPFTLSMWLLVVGCIFFLAFLIVIIDALSPQQGEREFKAAFRPSNIVVSVYHAWAFILGGEDYEWLSWAGRFIRLTFLFVVLILGATYTANLAAFFTAPSFKIHGPKSMDELRKSVACTTLGAESTQDPTTGETFVIEPQIKNYVSSYIAPPQQEPDKQGWVHQRLRNGTCHVWVDDVYVLNEYLVRNCQDLSSVEAIRLVPITAAARVRRDRWELAANLSLVITHLRAQPEYRALLRDSFGVGLSCPEGTSGGDTDSIEVRSMGGLFIIFAVGAGIAVIIATVDKILRVVRPERDEQEQAPTTEGEMLKLVLQRLDHLQTSSPRPLLDSGEFGRVHPYPMPPMMLSPAGTGGYHGGGRGGGGTYPDQSAWPQPTPGDPAAAG